MVIAPNPLKCRRCGAAPSRIQMASLGSDIYRELQCPPV
jgi:hypothetical protein